MRENPGRLSELRSALASGPVFAELTVRAWVEGAPEALQSQRSPRGAIGFRVSEGAVTLDGELPGKDCKRPAAAHARRAPGSRDVVKALGLGPPEEDGDEDMTEALPPVLGKGFFVTASQIRVAAKNRIATQAGLVPARSEREKAEVEAWCRFGVDKVVSRIEVRS